jgi:CDP-diacylglycerol--glycerol-3-phosphate 3-phosphatidyltransferase
MDRAAAKNVLTSYLGAPVARLLAKAGLSPNIVTAIGLLIAGASASLLAIGELWAGGLVLLGASVFDLFDGALARETGRVTRFGALFDSVVDRLSEAVVLFGLLVYFLDRSSTAGPLLVYLALVGSVAVSYVRARAEGLGIECEVGIMTRPERILILAAGIVVGHWWTTGVLIALGIVAALAFVTTAQRVAHSYTALTKRE